jgi:PPOX class probable FMN-dependent enzyme
MDDTYAIEDEQSLAEVIGQPLEFIDQKVLPALEDAMVDFIARSPLVFISTLDQEGMADVSPKGDPPGFTQVDPAGNLLIPERPGNRLTFGFKNILRDNRVGLIFVLPGTRETLRVKGRATLHRDPQVLEQMSVRGKPALMYTRVQVQECFFHCGKAMIRSKLWQPDSWQQPGRSPMVQQITRAMDGDEELEKVIEGELEKNYSEELY